MNYVHLNFSYGFVRYKCLVLTLQIFSYTRMLCSYDLTDDRIVHQRQMRRLALSALLIVQQMLLPPGIPLFQLDINLT